ncbi:MAG: carbohydrate-binding family 9-like protein [Fimbriimonas sp.]|nr:carbohydrate-binding family 9-like protein [Fimbriimonas sp.]
MRTYLCHKTPKSFELNGRLDKSPWTEAAWTDYFVDIEGDAKPAPRFKTRAKMLWNDEFLFVGAELEEPHVWATLTERDSVIFHDPDFEIFIDPNGDNQLYAEFEMNALNTVWDLLLIKAYRDGGPAVTGWDIHGLKSAVHVDGTLNDPTDTDRGWSVEVAFPWHALGEIAGKPCPPREGDQWRINFSRVEWHIEIVGGAYHKVRGLSEDNWVWSPQGVVDMHRPETWGLLEFTNQPFGEGEVHALPGSEERVALMEIYRAQQKYRGETGHWAKTLKDLGVYPTGASLYTTPYLYEAAIGKWHIDNSSRIWHE